MSRFLQLFLNYGLVLAIFGLGRHGCDDGLPSRVAWRLGVHSAVAGGARDPVGVIFLDTQMHEEQYEGTATGGKDTMKSQNSYDVENRESWIHRGRPLNTRWTRSDSHATPNVRVSKVHGSGPE